MNRDNFWNDERAKEFCEYAGFRIGKSTDIREQLNYLIEDFKASHTSAIEEREGRDWEILTLVDKTSKMLASYDKAENDCYDKPLKEVYHSREYWAECFLNFSHWKIHSVRRKSDGVVFTLGDGAYDLDLKGTIERIYIDERNQCIIECSNSLPMGNDFIRIISQIQPLPQRTKPPLGPLSREVEKLEERIAYIEKKLNIEG